MSRLAQLSIEEMNTDQREVAEAIISGPRGGMRGPFNAWLRSPGLARHAQELGAYVRFGTSLPRDLSELAILLTGKQWKAQFEFWAHARLAREAGLAEDIIEAIRTGKEPSFAREEERVIHDVVTEYFSTNRLSDATYRRVIDAFGEAGLVDLIGTVGYYGLVSMTLNIFEVPVPEGEAEPLS